MAISKRDTLRPVGITGRLLHCQLENHVQTNKKSIFYKLHHQNGSNFYRKKFMSRYTHIYYIVENDNQIWCFIHTYIYIYNMPFLTRMTQNWTRIITNYLKMPTSFKKVYKRYYQRLYKCRKNVIVFKTLYGT